MSYCRDYPDPLQVDGRGKLQLLNVRRLKSWQMIKLLRRSKTKNIIILGDNEGKQVIEIYEDASLLGFY